MKRRLRILATLAVCLCLTLVMTSCAKIKAYFASEDFYIYYGDMNVRELYPVKGDVDLSLDTSTLVYSVWNQMASETGSSQYRTLVPPLAVLKDFTLTDGILTLNFYASYNDLNPTEEILLRASAVRTFSQFPDVSEVEITVDSQPLLDASGSPFGAMKAEDFIDPIGEGSYRDAKVTLYFCDETGTKLVPEIRDITFSGRDTIEHQILECLISGPASDSGHTAVLPSGTKLLSVSVNDGMCLVNLSDDFLSGMIAAEPYVTVYSIVNTLTELDHITSVQLMVNSTASLVYRDVISLETPLMRNLDCLKGSTANE